MVRLVRRFSGIRLPARSTSDDLADHLSEITGCDGIVIMYATHSPVSGCWEGEADYLWASPPVISPDVMSKLLQPLLPMFHASKKETTR